MRLRVDGSILSSIVSTSVVWMVRSTRNRTSMRSSRRRQLPTRSSSDTSRALDRKLPTGFRKNLVVVSKREHAGGLDIKHGGVTIVANIARVYAIAGGRPQKGTSSGRSAWSTRSVR